MTISDAEVLKLFRQVHPSELPIGFYLVAPDGRFLIASGGVRYLLGMPMEGEISATIAEFYENPAQRTMLLEQAKERSRQGRYLQGALIRFCTRGGLRVAENTCRALLDPQTGAVVGYYGTLVDRTAEVESKQQEQKLQQRIEDLTTDIGRVLHANSSTLTMVRLAFDPVLALIATELEIPNPKGELSPAQETALLDGQAQKLGGAIRGLIANNPAERRLQALPQLRWEYLEQLVGDLNGYQQIVPVTEARPSFLRRLAADVTAILGEMRPGLAKEQVREVQRAALNLQRAAALLTATRAYVASIQMEHSLRALRDFATGDLRSGEERVSVSMRSIVDNAVKSLADFASSRGIEIVIRDHSGGAEIAVQERELQRAVANLVHNAIKYSWSRTGGTKPPWVSIEIRANDSEVSLSVENWGVPIPKDEIENNLIFNLGYRGRLSKDRNRLGTGVGLTDVLHAVQSHQGSVQVSSAPASSTAIRDENHPDYYQQPFITVFTIRLPRRKTKAG